MFPEQKRARLLDDDEDLISTLVVPPVYELTWTTLGTMGDSFEIVSEDESVRIVCKVGNSIILGRNPLTKVKDKSVSKEHLQIDFDSPIRYMCLWW